MPPEKLPNPGTQPGLQPLSADTSTQGLRQLSVTEGAAPPSAERHVDVSAEGNPVEEWLAQNPDTGTPEPTPAAEAIAETPKPAEAVADANTPPSSGDGSPDAVATKTDAPASETPTDDAAKPAAADPNAKPAEAVKPAEPAKPTYAPDETFALGAKADGTPVTWTREQLVTALSERTQLQPLAKEAENWRTLFGPDYAKAESNWKPLLEKLHAHQDRALLFDDILHDDALADYIMRSAAHFEAERAAGNVPPKPEAAPKRPAADPAEARIARLEAQLAAQERERVKNIVNKQIADAISEFPFLATEKEIFEDLRQTGMFLNQQNPAWGIPEAVNAKRSMYEAYRIQRAAAATPPADPTPPVPALLGNGGGASPGGTRGVDNGRPKKFDDPQDGVEDWLAKHPT